MRGDIGRSEEKTATSRFRINMAGSCNESFFLSGVVNNAINEVKLASASKLSQNSEQARLLHNARQTTKTDQEKNKRRGVQGSLGNGLIRHVATNIAVQLCELWHGYFLSSFQVKIKKS